MTAHNEQQPGSADLLPCPFCGSTKIDPLGWTGINEGGPGCDECGALADSPKLWNQRAAPVSAGQAVQVAKKNHAIADRLSLWLSSSLDDHSRQDEYRKHIRAWLDFNDNGELMSTGKQEFADHYYDPIHLLKELHANIGWSGKLGPCIVINDYLRKRLLTCINRAVPVSPPDGATPEQTGEFPHEFRKWDLTREDYDPTTRKPIAAAMREAERIDAMHKGVVGTLAAIKAEHIAAQPAEGSAQVAPDWISVDERLPDPGQRVIAFRPTAEQSEDRPIRVIQYTGRMRKSWQNVEHGFDCICHPTHWMPIPQAPRIDGDKQGAPCTECNGGQPTHYEGCSARGDKQGAQGDA